ncbi:hypothetical protein BaRGS_00016149, partial [Batillaria attramentaria]
MTVFSKKENMSIRKNKEAVCYVFPTNVLLPQRHQLDICAFFPPKLKNKSKKDQQLTQVTSSLL